MSSNHANLLVAFAQLATLPFPIFFFFTLLLEQYALLSFFFFSFLNILFFSVIFDSLFSFLSLESSSAGCLKLLFYFNTHSYGDLNHSSGFKCFLYTWNFYWIWHKCHVSMYSNCSLNISSWWPVVASKYSKVNSKYQSLNFSVAIFYILIMITLRNA